ncbi:DUF4253 domain-containing protein [Virgisporangium aurantiacum]|uniref:DUF4253 domain-containing protein n=1 Tax=Virgisporangium aurantiacum TaxID=175570 RepID=A0A8J3ZEP0_9ACTN|nr:DUF4253 domain-containing protein [Virgisporangium aurantiacum]GIJ59918.1 hypothetical protein Vau01_074340 [Virgisporangium aurantiacum]
MSERHPAEGLLADLGITPVDGRGLGPVWAFHAQAGELVPLWRRLRDAHDRSGLWPILIGPDYERFTESFEMSVDQDTAPQVARGLAMDVDAGLAELKGNLLSWTGDPTSRPPRGSVDGGEPPDGERFYLAKKAGWIALVRADAGHLVPGLLDWDGAANHEVEPALHVAVLKQWHERFGAELVGLGRDVIELRVPHPPTDPAEILAVAEQQYWYCPDVVDQGVGTLDGLMAVQVPARSWYFWWD